METIKRLVGLCWIWCVSSSSAPVAVLTPSVIEEWREGHHYLVRSAPLCVLELSAQMCCCWCCFCFICGFWCDSVFPYQVVTYLGSQSWWRVSQLGAEQKAWPHKSLHFKLKTWVKFTVNKNFTSIQLWHKERWHRQEANCCIIGTLNHTASHPATEE